MSIGFDRSRGKRQRELTNKKNIKNENHVRIYLKDVLGFAEHQETRTFGLGLKLTMTRNTDNTVLNKDNSITNSKFEINATEWYVPPYRPSLEQQSLFRNQITKKMNTELPYPERSVSMKEMNTQIFRTFELDTPEGSNIPVWIYVVFQRSDREHDQKLNNDTFYAMPVTSAQCVVGSEKYPDSGIFLNYDDDDYSQGVLR